MKKTLKARAHHGAKSLNLTIPVEIRRQYQLEAGDIFELEVIAENNEVSLIYKRVYSAS